VHVPLIQLGPTINIADGSYVQTPLGNTITGTVNPGIDDDHRLLNLDFWFVNRNSAGGELACNFFFEFYIDVIESGEVIDSYTTSKIEMSTCVCGSNGGGRRESLSGMNISRLEIYPNPVNNDALIANFEVNDFTQKADQELSIQILNLQGQRVLSESRGISKAGNQFSEKINVSTLAPGVYILQTRIGNDLISKKFIKQ